MGLKVFRQEGRQVILRTEDAVCESKRDLMLSDVFGRVLALYLQNLRRRDSPLIQAVSLAADEHGVESFLLDTLRALGDSSIEAVAAENEEARRFLLPEGKTALHEFVEGLYDFWRSFDRFMILHSEPGPSSLDKRPYRAFNATIEALRTLRSPEAVARTRGKVKVTP